MIHRCVGRLNEQFSAIAVGWEYTNPDACSQDEFALAIAHGLINSMNQFLGSMLRIYLFLNSREYYQKLVTPKACHAVVSSQAANESMCQMLQNEITGIVTHIIIDRFEVIDIYEQHRKD